MLLQQKLGAFELGAFVWSKMGAEAGQELPAILRRKEVERLMGGKKGKFFWGVGNSLGVSNKNPKDSTIALFMRDTKKPMAVFTRQQSKEGKKYKAPDWVIVWRKYKPQDGPEQDLPPHVLVTSGFDKKPPQSHYALLCECDESLPTQCHGKLNKGGLVNYRSDNPKFGQGSTYAVKVKDNGEKIGDDYCIRFAASLYGEGQVKLTKTERVVYSWNEWKKKEAKVDSIVESILDRGENVEKCRAEWEEEIRKK